MSDVRDPWDLQFWDEPHLAAFPERDDREARAQADLVRERLASYARTGRIGWLDLSCGTGRRAAALEAGAGATAGADESLPLLAAAARRVPRLAPGVFLARARRLPLPPRCVGAAVSFTDAFGLTDDPADDTALAAEVARVLAPGGAFLAAGVNPERVVRHLALREEKTVARSRVVVLRRYDPLRRMLEKTVTITDETGAARAFARRIRLTGEHEARARLRAAGLTVVSAWGDFGGAPFDRVRSKNLVLLATKPSTRAFGGAR